jgi:hypothetical protein
MGQLGRVFMVLFLIALGCSHSAFAQRRVFTNEDIQSAPPPAPPARPSNVPSSQAAPGTSGTPGTVENAAQPAGENAARRAAAEQLIKRMEEIQIAMRDASDIFFDKIREGTATQPTINKWNQVRDNLVLASDELGVFINEARRNLPPPAAPASAPAAQPQ